jgi:4-amino-4-deoxy-L-arabinose transferase-like glycosyltransferase
VRIIQSVLFLLSELALIFLLYSWFRQDLQDRINAIFKTYLSWTGYCVVSFFALEQIALLNNTYGFLTLNSLFAVYLLIRFHKGRKLNSLKRITKFKFPKRENQHKSNYKFITFSYVWISSLYFLIMISNFASSPTVDDEVTSYLVRIEHWVRAGYMQDFDVFPYHSTLNIYPIAFQSILLKLRLISGTDLSYQFLTYVATLVIALSIYRISRQITKSSTASNIAVIVFLSAPFTLQAAGMNLVDVFTTSLIILFMYFTVFDKRETLNERLFFSLLALSTAISARQSTVFFIPGFILLLFIALSRGHKLAFNYKWLGAFALFLIISTPIYLRNFFLYGHLLGNTEAFSYYTGYDSVTLSERIHLLQSNLNRFFYFFVFGDAPQSFTELLQIPLFDGFRTISMAILSDLHELGVAYYGFLAVPILLVVGIIFFVKDPASVLFKNSYLGTAQKRILLIVGLSLPIFLFLSSREFTHAFSRYLFPVYCLLIPVMIIGLYSVYLKKSEYKKPRTLVALLAVWLLVFSSPVVFRSEIKPILGQGSVFQLSREEESVLWMRTSHGYNRSQELLKIQQRVASKSKDIGTLCLDIRQKFAAYPFLYKQRAYEVIWVKLDSDKETRDELRKLIGCKFLLTDNKDLRVEIAKQYKSWEYFELNQIYIYGGRVVKEF